MRNLHAPARPPPSSLLPQSAVLSLVLVLLLGLAATALASDLEMPLSSPHEARRDLGVVGLILPRQEAPGFNLQTFTGALGGFPARPISQSLDSERPFEVDGDTFPDVESAVNRACDNQFQECQLAANTDDAAGFAVGDCDAQNNECKDVGRTSTPTSFPVLTSSNAEFDFFCDE